MGIISAIGNSVCENLEALLASKSGISSLSSLQTHHANSIKVGEVNLTNTQLSDVLNLPKNNAFTRTALLGLHAAKQALLNANITDVNAYKTGFISSTSVGGMDKTEMHIKEYCSNKEAQKYINSHHAGDSTQKMADAIGITGFVTTISTACSSAANAIMLGARLIKAGTLDRVIVGGVDPLSKFTINGFKTLMILSDSNCRPFDANRTGLNLGEAAAYLVLESQEIVDKENKKVLGYLAGYGNANDAFHQTASSQNGEGAYLAMQDALKKGHLVPSDISYINAHGTATANNDITESIAIRRVFGNTVPDFSSTKAFTGHTLAAAGAIEAVYAVLALQENVIFPNLNFKTPIATTHLHPVTTVKRKEIHNVLSNSFGFGGNCSTLIFSK